MQSLRHLFFLLLATLPITATWAQPEIKGHEHNGCHYYHTKPNPMGFASDDRSDDCGSNSRSDSIDILNYAVTLDLTKFTQQTVTAACEITFTAKQDGLGYLPLDLLKLTIDSVLQNGQPIVYDYNDTLLNLHLSNLINIGEVAKVTVFYHGKPTADPSGFGGFVFASGYAYNLGIGLSSNPYNFGRSWHPCFDNFVERATYDIHLISSEGRKGYAVGEFLGETDLGGGNIKRSYRMGLPLPTYLVGSATSNYAELHGEHTGVYGTYPTLLVGKPGDTTQMKTSFQYLPQAIDALEAWFGPYRWGQVGYVLTSAGAMEHSTLIAYPDYSIDGGANYGMNRLMAHELGHHWWGNVTTLSCPFNMWIKEGNAEYSSHLFQEFAFGKEYFKKVVKDNNQTVLKTAHLDDGGYLPLSGLPYENTYGTHTYQKGAAIMHNLRGYLGDSLFQQGMTSILDTYEYQSVDAELFRDQLTANTGVDMNPFFDDWIFVPGYALYELDSFQYAPSGNGYEARLYVQQKLHHAPHFHTNDPMSITFFDENWQTHTKRFVTNGEFTEVVVNVPFQPVWQVLNDDNLLNLGRMQDRTVVNSTGTVALQYCDLSSLQVTQIPAGDSALVSCVHYLGAADPDPSGIQLSTAHYWRFGGVIPDGFNAKVVLNYRGASANDLDHDLTTQPEDSLTLVWRPRPGVAWGQYPYYKKFMLTANDGNGFIRVDTFLPGDYAFAAGSLPLATGVLEKNKNGEIAIAVYPNPSSSQLTVQAAMPSNTLRYKIELYDAMGRVVKQANTQVQGGLLAQTLDVSMLQAGVYHLKILDEGGAAIAVEKFIKN